MKKIPLVLKYLLHAMVAAVVSLGLAAKAQSVWNATIGISPNTNWSTAANWLPNDAAPSVGTNVLFDDLGSVGGAATINNVVDTDTTIASLQYGQTNGFHNTFINSGVTLTVSNNAATNMLVAGTETDNGISQAETNTVSGAGSLVVNNTNAGSVLIVRQASFNAGAHQSTLDLSGLGTFTASIGVIHVGLETENIPIQRPVGIWLLAKTNTITASRAGTTPPAIDIGDGRNNGGNGIVQLGITNAIFADSMAVGYSKSRTLTGAFPLTGSTLQFNPAISNTVPTPALYLRGNSSSRVGILSVGDNSAVGGGVLTTGTINLSGGTVDAQVDTCYIGRGQNTNGTGTSAGTLTFSAGVFDVNTLEIGYVTTNIAIANVTGTVNVNGSASTLRVNTNLRLGQNPDATAIGKGTLNINTGTVLANSIISGSAGANTTIKLNHGTLVISNSAGSATAPIGTFIATNNSTIQLGVAANTTNLIVGTLAVDSTGAATNTLNISRVPGILSYPAQFTAISYTNLNAFSFQLGTLPATSPPLAGYLSNNVANSSVDLVITNGPASASTPIPLSFSQAGNVLTFSWTNASFRLQSQTNTLNTGISTNWVNYPGGGASPVSLAIDPANPTVFFRLISP